FLPQRAEEIVTRHPSIREAIAAAVTDRNGLSHLALALIGDPGDALDGLVEEIRAALRGIVPSLVVRMADFPRTPTGKAVRRDVAAALQRRFDAAERATSTSTEAHALAAAAALRGEGDDDAGPDPAPHEGDPVVPVA